MPQFNGKQEGRVARSAKPHLRCPRNGQADELVSSSVSVDMPLVALNKRLGRRQRLSPPARIPANKVTLRKQGCMAHALSGKAVRALDLRRFMNFRTPHARAFAPLFLVLSALSVTCTMAQTASQVVVTASRT